MKILRFYFTALLTGLLCFAEENIPYDLKTISHDDNFYRAFEFPTDEFYTYTIQNSSNGVIWNNVTTFHGFNETALYPFAFLPTATQATAPILPYSSTPITLSLKRAVGGGTIMTWRSLVDGRPKRVHVASISLGAHWDGSPFFHYTTDLYNYFIESPSSIESPIPTDQSSLITSDKWFKDHFIATEFSILDSEFQSYSTSNNLMLPVANGGNSLFRVVAEIADEDFDGLTDFQEQLAERNGGTGTDHQDPDTDDDEVWDGAEVAQGTDPKDPLSKPTNPPSRPPDAANPDGNGPPGTGTVLEVDFRKNHNLVSDNLKTKYHGPHWVADSHNFPTSYARTQSVYLRAKFFIAPPAEEASTEYEVEATLPNDVYLHRTALLHIGDNIYRLLTTECKGGIPEGGTVEDAPKKTIADTIEWYSAQKPGKEYEIQWTIYENDEPSNAGTTTHTIYITNDQPGDSQISTPIVGQQADFINQESIFYHACKLADGEVANDEAGKSAIADMLYQEFVDQAVYKVQPSKGLLQSGVGNQLSYWGDMNGDGFPDLVGAGCATGRRLLMDVNNNGNCQAWAGLFSDILNAHNFGSKIVFIKPKHPHEFFLVKNAEEHIEPAEDF
ncbi:hypothetical protein OAG53_01610 [Akkermansiaceae bacterium]|nr:hypothetical protein [Akkermansiaceae bacterium]